MFLSLHVVSSTSIFLSEIESILWMHLSLKQHRFWYIMYIITISKVGLHVAVVSQNRLPWHRFARQLVSMCLLRLEKKVRSPSILTMSLELFLIRSLPCSISNVPIDSRPRCGCEILSEAYSTQICHILSNMVKNMWVVSNLSHLHWGEKKHWNSVLHPFLCQPRSTAWMSQHPNTPPTPTHSTSAFHPAPINSQPHFLSNFFPLLSLSTLTSLFSLSSWFSPSFTFHSCHTLSSITRGLCFFRNSARKGGGGRSLSASPPQKTRRESNADLNSQLVSYTFFSLFLLTKNFKALCERQGLVAWWTSEDI